LGLKCRFNSALLLDVDLHGDEVVIDETLHARVGVDLGIQPSTTPSHRSGVEIQQQRALAGPRIRKRFIQSA